MNNKKVVFFVLPITLLFFSMATVADSWVELHDSFDEESTKPWIYKWVSKTSGDGSSGIFYNAAEENHYGYIRSATGRASLGRTVTLDMERLGSVGKCAVYIKARKVTPVNSPMTLRIEVLDLASWRYITRIDKLITSNSYQYYGTEFFRPKGASIHVRFVDGDESGVTTAYLDDLQISCGTFTR